MIPVSRITPVALKNVIFWFFEDLGFSIFILLQKYISTLLGDHSANWWHVLLYTFQYPLNNKTLTILSSPLEANPPYRPSILLFTSLTRFVALLSNQNFKGYFRNVQNICRPQAGPLFNQIFKQQDWRPLSTNPDDTQVCARHIILLWEYRREREILN